MHLKPARRINKRTPPIAGSLKIGADEKDVHSGVTEGRINSITSTSKLRHFWRPSRQLFIVESRTLSILASLSYSSSLSLYPSLSVFLAE